ncbi:MAG: endopeptidase [Bacilli bacterium]|nr:endopeptidase [Bacilli bacterium]
MKMSHSRFHHPLQQPYITEQTKEPTKQQVDLSTYSVRTDLAVEARELAGQGDESQQIPGVRSEEYEDEGIKVTWLRIESQEGSRRIGKVMGNYLTLEIPGLRYKDPVLQQRVSEVFAAELQKYLKMSENDTVLVIGLGNWNVTPDALGPLVANKIFVTRHLFTHLPHVVEEGYRPVSAVSPGVLGITGIETTEIVRGIVEHVKPDLVIAIDALASRSLDRVNTTIQVADTGITPGSGVGNKRKGLTKEALGVPVIAIGVPTVVDASTIANDCIQLVLDTLEQRVPGNGCNQILGQFNTTERHQLIHELLSPIGNNLMVTPKEIDAFVDDVAKIVASGLNMALHEAISAEDAAIFLQ